MLLADFWSVMTFLSVMVPSVLCFGGVIFIAQLQAEIRWLKAENERLRKQAGAE